MNGNIAYTLGLGLFLAGAYYGLSLTPYFSPVPMAVPSAASSAPSAPIAPMAAASVPASAMAARFANHLFVMGQDGNVHDFDSSKLAGVKYYAFYYSGYWCGPSRDFTPELVQFYNNFKPTHPNFELIFVSDDKSEGEMLHYMTVDGMRWPAVRYQDQMDPALDPQQYAGDAIPDLVLVGASGNVLADTYQDGQYLGPQRVIEEIQNIVP